MRQGLIFPNLADRVRWFKTRAAMQRWREEIQMRFAEFDCLKRAYDTMTSIWFQISEQPSSPQHRVAYACKMSDYYSRRATECQKLYENARLKFLAKNIKLHEPV